MLRKLRLRAAAVATITALTAITGDASLAGIDSGATDHRQTPVRTASIWGTVHDYAIQGAGGRPAPTLCVDSQGEYSCN